MADLEPIPYPDAKIRSILERVRTIALVGASPNWNRPELLRDEVSAGQGLSRDPRQSGHRRQNAARREGLRVAPRHSGRGRHGRHVPRRRGRAGRRRRGDRDRRQGRVDAARHPQRCGGGGRRGRRGRSRHEPLPEDRVRAARRRIVVERGQQRASSATGRRIRHCRAGSSRGRRRRATFPTASRPARSMPAPRPTRRPARARRRSTRRRPMCSTTSTTPPRSSICTISATSIRA